MNARLLALALAVAGGAHAAVVLRSPEEALKAVADKLLSTDTPAEGEPLVAMGVDDDAVVVVGVSLAAVNGDVLTVGGKRMLDSRFWGGPLYDGRGRLVAIGLISLGPPKAISARVIQRMLDQRAGMGLMIGAVPAEQNAP